MAESVLVEKPEEIFDPIKLRDEEINYMSGLKRRLTDSKNRRDRESDFFDGMDYQSRCEQNRKLAATYIKPKKNKNETQFSTGTARQKLMALLAHLQNLNLLPDITARDKDNMLVSKWGNAMEDLVKVTEDIDGDDEKKIWRWYNLLVQGETFVEEVWEDIFAADKSIPKFDGKFKGVEWTTRLKKLDSKATRNIIRNEKVYLGDITQPDFKKQPYVFTVDVMSYSRAKAVFGEWENWKHVPKELKNLTPETEENTKAYTPYWQLTETKKGFVEIVRYQDQYANEFQIVLNGVPMLPIGFPLPWKHGGYNLSQQILEPVDSHFAYGKSLMQRLKQSQALEDEFWKLVLLKGHQSAVPPMANMTGRVLSSRVLLPGTFNYGIDPERLKPLIDSKGPNQAEFAILQLLRENIDEHSVNPTFTGQSPSREATATEVLETQRQAQAVLNLTVFACASLEKKLTDLRINTVLEKWFEPIGNSLDEVRGGIKKLFRSATVETQIPGEGSGQRIIEMVEKNEQIPSPFQQLVEEENISRTTGIPTRKIILSKEEIRKSKLLWKTNINPQPRNSTNLQRLMFREELLAMREASPNVSMKWAEERAATVWGEDPAKVFNPREAIPQEPRQSGTTPLEGIAGKINKTNTPNSVTAQAASR